MRTLFLSILIATLFIGCVDIDEQLTDEIIGKYSFTQTIADDELFMTSETTIYYGSNGSFDESSIITITSFIEDYGKINLKYDISASGRYNIKNTVLYANYNTNSVKIEPVIAKSSPDTDISEYFHSIFDDHLIPDLKQELLKGTAGTIDELTHERLVLIDAVGNRTILKRSYSLIELLYK